MEPLFLVTILSCQQVLKIIDRVGQISILTQEQKHEIVKELRKSVPSCPIIIKEK